MPLPASSGQVHGFPDPGYWQNERVSARLGRMERLTARDLFDKVSARLALRWVAGQQGETRAIVPAEKQSRRAARAGYLNTI